MLTSKYLLPFFLSILISCSSQSGKNIDTVRDDHLDKAVWIEDKNELPVMDSLFYEDHPAPLFRKEFDVGKSVTKATLYITAAGYYLASINGERIGRNFLDPAWTNYSKRIYYSEYDLSIYLNEGKNCLGVTLGNGFYNPLPMKMWGRRNLREKLPVGKPQFIARLELNYSDGSTDDIITDHTWKHSYGPIIKNNVFLGEIYDARREIPGWDKPGFDDSSWHESVTHKGPGGTLQKAFFPPVQVTDTLKPIAVSTLPNEVYIVDMGVNFTGLFRMRLKGKQGDTIIFRFGERIYENGELNPMTAVCGQIKRKGMGGPGAPDTAWQTDSYIFGEKTDIWYMPEFTFHVYRYMEITGLPYKPPVSDIEGIVFNSNVENKSRFSCSSKLINSIQEATVRTFLANLISVQSDCPGREKFAYGGDLNATSEAFIYNFDMQAFYRKTVYDWVDAMNDTMFIDTAPYLGIEYCGISWESAFLITQYQLLLYYNDLEFIKELYPLNLQWMEKVNRIHPAGLVDAGLADHESLEPVPAELIGTTHYLQCARIMGIFAGLFNDKMNVEKFAALEKELSQIVLERFWENPVEEPINKQTLFSTLLYHKILPEDQIDNATDSLFKALDAGPAGHFTTGIFGTKYILEALSERGFTDSVFRIVNSTLYPGWGYMIDRGATSIWETWKESDNVYSNCHPMFGSVSEWFYRWLGGIRPDPDYPGFERFVIDPHLPQGLDSVNCVYYSPKGEIVSKWKKYGNEKLVFKITVPQKSLALTRLPVDKTQQVSIRNYRGNTAISYEWDGEYHIRMRLKPGKYIIEVVRSK